MMQAPLTMVVLPAQAPARPPVRCYSPRRITGHQGRRDREQHQRQWNAASPLAADESSAASVVSS
jgi:hypothetical protein